MRQRPCAVAVPPTAGSRNKNVALLTRERDEALEQQTATSEVLRVISGFTGRCAAGIGRDSRERRPHVRGTNCRHCASSRTRCPDCRFFRRARAAVTAEKSVPLDRTSVPAAPYATKQSSTSPTWQNATTSSRSGAELRDQVRSIVPSSAVPLLREGSRLAPSRCAELSPTVRPKSTSLF